MDDRVEERRIDDLARDAGVATTTIRLYQRKGLLPPPRIEGRTGWYGPHHLARLRLIGRLQDEGFSLAGIGRLVEAWERGSSLDAVVGVEAQLEALLGGRPPVDVDPVELAARFPAGSMTPELMRRAAGLGLVELTDDGRLRLPDPRFAETGAALAALGVPLDVVLDEWEALAATTDELAGRFVALFEEHLLPDGAPGDLDPAATADLAASLATLHRTAHEVIAAALDASLARVGRERLRHLLPDVD